MKGKKFGGRPPARGQLHSVSFRSTEREHRRYRVASAHAGLPGGHGQFIAHLVDSYLEAHGIQIDDEDDGDKEEAR